MASPRSAIRSRQRLHSGTIGIVANLAAGDVGQLLVEQRGERAQDAALGLAAQAEQDEVLLRQDGVHDLRNDGVFVADDAGKERFPR